jgi:DNA-binding NarL/FixJ family response regulator
MVDEYDMARSRLRECLVLFRRLGDDAGVAACQRALRQMARSLGEQQPIGYGVLSPREREVTELVARGYTNREIARALHIADGTARRHVSNILARLDLHSRAQIASWLSGYR